MLKYILLTLTSINFTLADINEAKLLNYAAWGGTVPTSKYFQNITLPLEENHINARLFAEIAELGKYEIKHFNIKNKTLTFQYLPLSYKHATRFYLLDDDNSKVYLKEKTFSAQPIFLSSFLKLTSHKKLIKPFYFTTLRLSTKKNHPDLKDLTYLVIFNRLGEVIWTYKPKIYDVINAVALKNNNILLFSNKWQEINFTGNILREGLLLKAHHMATEHNGRYYFLGDVYQVWRPTLIGKGHQIKGSSIFYLNPKTGKLRNILTSFDDPKYFKDRLSEKIINEKRKGVIDVTHENSVIVTEEGLLLTAKKSHRIGYFSQTTKKLLWSIGHSEIDTCQLGPDSIYYPHSAVISEDKVLYVNNGKEISKLSLVESPQRNCKVTHFIPDEKIHSTSHGSAYFLTKDHFFSFMQNNKEGLSDFYLYDFNMKGNITGKLTMDVYPTYQDYSFYIITLLPLPKSWSFN